MYINPWYAIEGGNTSFSVNGFTIYGPAVRGRSRAPIVNTDGKVGLLEHMMRGLSALGLIGFGKVLLFSHHWIRYVFGGGPVGLNRGRGDGRDRIGQLSWIIIIWGVVNFLIFVWGAVRTVVSQESPKNIRNCEEELTKMCRPRGFWTRLRLELPTLEATMKRTRLMKD